MRMTPDQLRALADYMDSLSVEPMPITSPQGVFGVHPTEVVVRSLMPGLAIRIDVTGDTPRASFETR